MTSELLPLQHKGWRGVRFAQVTRTCVNCGEDFSHSGGGQHTGFCQNCREKLGLVDHAWDSEKLQEGHYGKGMHQPKVATKERKAIFAIGLPGSGKSTVLKPLAEQSGAAYVSSDAIRKEVTGDEADVSQDAKVWPLIYERVHQGLENPGTVIIDATGTHGGKRREFLQHIRQKADRVEGLLFDVPLDVALDRNRNRDRKVPEDIIGKMHEQLRDDPPSEEEGFDSITRIGWERGQAKRNDMNPANNVGPYMKEASGRCPTCRGAGYEWEKLRANRDDPKVDQFMEGMQDYEYSRWSLNPAPRPVAPKGIACDSCGGRGLVPERPGGELRGSNSDRLVRRKFIMDPASGFGARYKQCEYCQGEGKVTEPEKTKACWRCNGTGNAGTVPCYWCGTRLKVYQMQQDRVNPDLGYVLKNVVPACDGCNQARNRNPLALMPHRERSVTYPPRVRQLPGDSQNFPFPTSK